MHISIQASKFKARCLQLLEEVQNGNTYLITKRGVPLAKLEALPKAPLNVFGSMSHSCMVTGDIVAPIKDFWEAQDD